MSQFLETLSRLKWEMLNNKTSYILFKPINYGDLIL